MTTVAVSPKMKDSGIAWIGDIPAHWELRKVAWAFRITGSGTTPTTSVESYFTGEIPWVNTGDLNDGYIIDPTKMVSQRALNEFSALRYYPKGTLLIALYGATIGKLGMLSRPSTVNQACIAMGDADGVHSKFAFYWFLGNRRHIIAMAYGGGQPNISGEIIKQLRLTIPPLPEQQTISDFLDRKTAQIDALIAKKQRLIELLGEKRQALISHAVTRGLDSNMPMKDSGFPWLGEVPTHWIVREFRFCGSIPNGQVDPRLTEFKTKVLIAPNHIQSGTGRLIACETADEQGADSGKYQVRKGSVVYSKIRPELAKACIAPVDSICSADMYPITPTTDILPDYLLYVLLSDWFTSFAVVTSARVAMPKINRDELGNCYFVVPPVEEQQEIVAHIKSNTQSIDSTDSALRKQIAKLQEYRQTLISAAVTGKIDVMKEAV